MRRRSMVTIFTLLTAPMLLLAGTHASQESRAAMPTPLKALEQLLEGNHRFVEGLSTHPHQTGARVKELSGGQHPFATILCCGDSRVSPEILFDQGLGDLFVVRVAGNVDDEDVSGSLGYSVDHLHSPILMVLGHEKCGAVTAALDKASAPAYVKALLHKIAPAVDRARGMSGDLLDNAVRENVKLVLKELRKQPFVASHVAAGELKIIGAYYHLDTGSVEILR